MPKLLPRCTALQGYRWLYCGRAASTRGPFTVALIGLALGVGGAFGLTKLLQSMLYSVSPTDTLTFRAAPALLAAVALVACFVPAQRATRVDPARVLKAD